MGTAMDNLAVMTLSRCLVLYWPHVVPVSQDIVGFCVAPCTKQQTGSAAGYRSRCLRRAWTAAWPAPLPREEQEGAFQDVRMGLAAGAGSSRLCSHRCRRARQAATNRPDADAGHGGPRERREPGVRGPHRGSDSLCSARLAAGWIDVRVPCPNSCATKMKRIVLRCYTGL